MNRKRAAVLAGGMTLALALAGCGDDGSEQRNAWAKKVCDQVKPQVQKIQQANTSINEASESKRSPEEVKETDSKAFGDIADAYDSLASAVQKAGDPPVENGATLRKDAVKQLQDLSGEYAELQSDVDKLETGDQSEFAGGLKDLATRLGQLGESGDDALQKLQAGELGEAMAAQQGCKRSDPGATPGA